MKKVLEILLEGMMGALAALPLRFHYAWAGFVTWIMRDVVHYRKDVVMINLARAFPDKKYRELAGISRQFYRHLGEIFAEMIWFGGCRNPQRLVRQGLMKMSNPEVLYKALENEKGVVLLDSHCGNWELLGGIFEYDESGGLGKRIDVNDMIVVYKPLGNKVWNDVIKRNRCAPVARRGYKGCLASMEVLRYAIEHKNEQKVYLFPNDQYPYKISKAHDPVTFMHQETEAMDAAVVLAHKFGMSVVYMNMLPVSRGHYEMRFTQICEDASTMTPHEMNLEFYRLLEQDVNETPWNYLWTHKRWK